MDRQDALSLLRAIEAERRAAKRDCLECTVYHSDRLPGPAGSEYAVAYLARIRRGNSVAASLDERFEGGRMWFPNGAQSYEIVSVDEQNGAITVRLAGEDLPPMGERARLYEPDFLRALDSWVRTVLCEPVEGARALLPDASDRARQPALEPPGTGAIVPSAGDRGPSIHLLWGPPGTGKTYRLGEVLAQAWASGNRACGIAPTHVAADQLALATSAAMQRMGWRPEHGVIVRYGQQLKSSQVELPSYLGHESPDVRVLKAEATVLRNRLRRCKSELVQLRPGTDRYSRLQTEIAELTKTLGQMQEKVRDLTRQLLSQASILICTAHALVHNEEILKRQDALRLADEASMISLAFVAPFLRSATRQFLFGGDFLQLPPICQAEGDRDARRWFARTIFHHYGLPGREQELEAEGVLTMLTEQRRMRPEICEFVSRWFYHGRLTTIGEHPFEPSLQGWPADAFVWVDPNLEPSPGTMPAPGGGRAKSWDRSASRAAEWSRTGLQLSETTTVATITPWRTQERTLRSVLGPELQTQRLRVGTVHKLQGQEADVVVFDVVDSQSGPLRHNPERIVNVAVSRARKQVIVVATADQIRRHAILSRLPLPAKPLAKPPEFGLRPELPPSARD